MSDRRRPKFAVVASTCLSAGVPILWFLATDGLKDSSLPTILPDTHPTVPQHYAIRGRG